ncbi:hypothetical protein A2U01_0107346, partial [Trifolium medium]|nr:hypothetical protein [Trifolium medium]
ERMSRRAGQQEESIRSLFHLRVAHIHMARRTPS